MISPRFLLLIPFVTSFAIGSQVTNDWSKPCLSGTCTYDLATTGKGSGSVLLSGSPNAISDITTAAGWEIIDCDGKALNQNIRLVCTDEAAGCAHLYGAEGAVNKLVRLPESCGAGPFARVAKAWVPEDQSLPAHLQARFVRRGTKNSKVVVKALSLDTNFAAIPTSAGHVSIEFTGTNKPSTIAPPKEKRSFDDLEGRSFFGNIGNAISGAASSVGNAISGAAGKAENAVTSVAAKAGNAVATKAEAAAAAVTSVAGKGADAIAGAAKDTNDISIDKSTDLPPVSFEKKLVLLDLSAKCAGIDGTVKADIDGKATAKVTIGVSAKGTIVPPKLTQFALKGGLDASIDGDRTVAGDAAVTADSGQIPLFETGIPGLSFPGLLDVGPSFKVAAQAQAVLDVGISMKVGLNYEVKGAAFTFPPVDGAAGAFTPSDNNLQLSLTPGVKATGNLTAHLIPQLDFGINALNSVANANIFVALDTSATLSMSLSPDLGSKNIKLREESRELAERDVKVTGCVNVGTGFDVNVGADAKLFDIFDQNVKKTLFSKKFDIFKKCLNGAVPTRRDIRRSRPRRSHLYDRAGALTCSSFTVASPALEPIFGDLVKGGDIEKTAA